MIKQRKNYVSNQKRKQFMKISMMNPKRKYAKLECKAGKKRMISFFSYTSFFQAIIKIWKMMQKQK